MLPSEAEPWGLIVNEVMNAGKPVIVTDQVGAAPDLVRDGVNGYVVPVKDAAALADRLRRVTCDAETARRMGQQSLTRINEWGFREGRGRAGTGAGGNGWAAPGSLKRSFMQVVQAVNGKFHHFHLARQLHQRGMLTAIFSTYPAAKLNDQQIPMSLVHTFPYLKLPYLAAERYSLGSAAFRRKLAWQVYLTFDHHVATHLPECDVFVGISCSGLKAGRLAQNRGGKYICDRGSSHIRFWNEILIDEFQRWGQRYSPIPDRNVQREEEEYAQADMVTVPSGFACDTFVQMGCPRSKLKVVAYGADLARFSKVAEPAPDAFDVLYVGAVSFLKGIPYLLEAFQRLRHPRKRLTIVGQVLPEMAAFLQGRSFDNVEWKGIMPHVQLKEVMSRSHVMVFPSLNDGFGMVIGEAMACGCPVISSENCGGRDIYRDGDEGFVVPPQNVDAITERLEQFVQDPALRQQMSEKSVQRVRELGGWDTYGRNYVDLLNSLKVLEPVSLAPQE